ncbi:MAG: hypothetical protein Q8R10_19455 [Pseudomonas sp.]|uniref:hypothetical protein n=1 Tax=Pseudomonas sp. TaxID=306 RepID=UPI002733F62D|nr:hypothetical protein [Pseudomonas sp.]MDP3848601.1 hypothetical protein [Pseudomonas sp.]
MNRTLDEAAAVLGIKPRALRKQLRGLGVLTQLGELACKYRDKGHLYIDPRSRWNPSIRQYSHYAVVMSTEQGLGWLAQQLGINVTNKDAAA